MQGLDMGGNYPGMDGMAPMPTQDMNFENIGSPMNVPPHHPQPQQHQGPPTGVHGQQDPNQMASWFDTDL